MTENKGLKTEEQRIGELALRTAQWCNACLYQFRRFVDAIERDDGKEPWDQDENISLLHAESMFLITAVYQTICYLEALQTTLQKKGDVSLNPILNAVAPKNEREKIRHWRNTNEHERDYIQGTGKEQTKIRNPDAFLSKFFVGVTDGMIYINGTTKEFYLGCIRIDHLISRIKENRPAILKRTKEIFYTCYYGIVPQNEGSYLPREEQP